MHLRRASVQWCSKSNEISPNTLTFVSTTGYVILATCGGLRHEREWEGVLQWTYLPIVFLKILHPSLISFCAFQIHIL
jgi:hypothetical protein